MVVATGRAALTIQMAYAGITIAITTIAPAPATFPSAKGIPDSVQGHGKAPRSRGLPTQRATAPRRLRAGYQVPQNVCCTRSSGAGGEA